MPDSPDKSTIAEAESYIKSSVTVLRGFVEVYDASIPEELEEVILVLCGQAILGFPSRDSLQDAVARLGLEFLCSNAPSRLSLSVQLVCACSYWQNLAPKHQHVPLCAMLLLHLHKTCMHRCPTSYGRFCKGM